MITSYSVLLRTKKFPEKIIEKTKNARTRPGKSESINTNVTTVYFIP
jgi:hypothetical protein